MAVVDERQELSGAVHGVPQFDLGPRTDVLSGCPKGDGMLMLLRSMNPQWIAVDEITQPEDIMAPPAGGQLRRQTDCNDPRWLCRGVEKQTTLPEIVFLGDFSAGALSGQEQSVSRGKDPTC